LGALTYKRNLSKTEAKRHFVYVDSENRDFFPNPCQNFIVKVSGDKREVSIDKKGRILASIFWELLPSFREGDLIIFSKESDRVFTVTME
jgi:hypothetical protein